MVTWIPLEMSMLRRSLRTQALIQELGNLDNEDSNDSQDTQDTPLNQRLTHLTGEHAGMLLLLNKNSQLE